MRSLHLTHTDIKSDSRILKEMHAVAGLDAVSNVSGVGVYHDEGSSSAKDLEGLDVFSITLKSRNWRFLPTILRHSCSLVELTMKMLGQGVSLKPNLIHCHDTLVLPLGFLLKIFTGAKLIYDAHELESNRNGLTKVLGKMTLFVEKRLWRFVDALIVVSPSIANWYALNIGEKHTAVILNSPVLEESSNEFDSDYLKRKFSVPLGEKVFLYIGILGQGRGLDLICEAFKAHGLTAHVVFLGYGELKADLLELSKEYKNIHVHDAVPHEKVVQVARSADVGLCLIQNVSLSDYYCLPNKLFEYCFAGVPVLASEFPDLSETIKKYKLGVSCDLNSAKITAAISSIEKEGLPAINVDDLHDLSWSAQAEKLAKLYNDVIREG